MVPDMQGALTLDFAKDAVCSAREMVGNLEHIRDFFRNGDREDEKICGSQRS